jgi:hypothetical protein
MFECKNERNSQVTHGKFSKMITEAGLTPNADLLYEEGYLNADGEFVSLGINTLHLQDREEQKDEEAGNVTQGASTDYTDFMNYLTTNGYSAEVMEVFLENKLAK